MARGDSGQVLILIGFILALALVTVTVMLSDVITVSNVASVESTDITKGDLFQAARLVKEEVDFARSEYIDPANASTFSALMSNFTYFLGLSFASKGINVEANWSGAGYLEGIINSTDTGKIAYCGRANASSFTIRNWLIRKGYNFSDYSHNGQCEDRGTDGAPSSVGKMFRELCKHASSADNQNCTSGAASITLNQTVAIFEFDNLSALPGGVVSQDVGCNVPDARMVLNSSQCKTLQNWTKMGGKFIKTGGFSLLAANSSLIDVLTGPVFGGSGTWDGYSLGGASVDVEREWGAPETEGIVAPYYYFPALDLGTLSRLLKNAETGFRVQFPVTATSFLPTDDPRGVMAAGICATGDYASALGCVSSPPLVGSAIALNWTYGGGQVYYLPSLEGELRTSFGKAVIGNPDDLRPLFNLTSPGGDCRVNVTASDWRTRYEIQLLC